MAGIADIGRGLQRYGLKVAQHPEFGGVGEHSRNSHHYYGEAIDVTDWRNGNTPMPEYEGGQSYDWVARTRRLKERAREIGGFNEVLGPGDKNHDEHLHLALQGKRSDWNEQMLEYLATGRYKGADGQYQTRWGGGGGLQPAATSTADVVEVGRQEALAKAREWQESAADPQRVVSPSDAAYYQRSDIQQWAGANPSLAAALMQKHGIDPSALQTPSPSPSPAPGSTQVQPGSTATPAPTPAPTPTPQDRGALNGTQVGRRPSLQPYAFEIHADASASAGGKTGFIGSYLDQDNTLFQALNKEYGNYGPNHSRQWRGGDLGAPRRGLSIIETRTAGPGMNDPAQQQEAAQRLLRTFTSDPDVKAGRRQVHLFVGHGDTDRPEVQGASGGDAKESAWNAGVFNSLRTLTQQQKLSGLVFHDPKLANEDDSPDANWNRALMLRNQWVEQNKGGQGQ